MMFFCLDKRKPSENPDSGGKIVQMTHDRTAGTTYNKSNGKQMEQPRTGRFYATTRHSGRVAAGYDPTVTVPVCGRCKIDYWNYPQMELRSKRPANSNRLGMS